MSDDLTDDLRQSLTHFAATSSGCETKSARSSSGTRDRRRHADRPVRRRPRAARRRAGAGQDAARAHAGRCAAPEVQADSVHARPDAGRHDRHERRAGDARRAASSSSFSRGRSSPTSCWPTRSTARRPRRSRPCSKRCRSIRSPSAAQTHKLEEPFFVMATQNPLEKEGTYPLPEAQLDRFFFKLLVKFPTGRGDGDDPRPHDRGGQAAGRAGASTASGSWRCRSSPGRSRSPPRCAAIGIALVMATHPEQRAGRRHRRGSYVRYGASPRGAQAMILAAKIRAILDHRYHVAAKTSADGPGRPAAPPDPELRRPGRGRLDR